MKNEFGVELSRAGYAPSIMQHNECCALCGRSWGAKLDRHEPWGAANRQKSKELGLWVTLCHFGCHEGPGSVHDDGALARQFRKDAQRAAMLRYGWSLAEWIGRFGKSELTEAEAARIIQKDAFTNKQNTGHEPSAAGRGRGGRAAECRSISDGGGNASHGACEDERAIEEFRGGFRLLLEPVLPY